MASETDKLRGKLSLIDASLDELEAHLQPLIEKSLPETLVGLETIQQAKLQVALPYLVYDLIFSECRYISNSISIFIEISVYLKARGIDPRTHPVIAELDSVRQYFQKIKDAEDSETKKRAGIDKAAASRFIKHAIAQVNYTATSGGSSEIAASAGTRDVHIPIKVTSKMAERAEYEKTLKDIGSEEEEELEIFDQASNSSSAEDEMEQVPAQRVKGKGKQREVDNGERGRDGSGSIRKRPRIDPFAGYDDTLATKNTSPKKQSSVSASVIRDNTQTDETPSNPSDRSTPLSGSDAKKKAKVAKKAKRRSKKSID
ncbi:hypothetical protein BJ138DRAFT_629259 [Hygrophoropsis aurantiaca]|uniref:Uncharacterized protein n=1 Tax=Hygrophoropsis aurantiaca TaxID=72124 RepID=A0ACB7ZZ04_9AGAM|nr:hypothetical protein BJ138DRAFT_629259 [Hygrophoropsis aurantiaca]